MRALPKIIQRKHGGQYQQATGLQAHKGEGPDFRPGLLEPRVPSAYVGFRRHVQVLANENKSQAATHYTNKFCLSLLDAKGSKNGN